MKILPLLLRHGTSHSQISESAKLKPNKLCC